MISFQTLTRSLWTGMGYLHIDLESDLRTLPGIEDHSNMSMISRVNGTMLTGLIQEIDKTYTK